jgi:hypothetical protein
MKIFTILFLVFNLATFKAQELIKQYKPIEIFNYSFKVIDVNDSIKYEVLEYNDIYSPYNPITKFQKQFSKHRKYKLENGQKVSLDIYNDTIILFKEFVKSKIYEGDSLISSGELKINKRKFELKEMNLANNEGEDSLVIDTLFQLIPFGFWSINVDFKTFEIGSFENGLKTGSWYLINSEYSSRFKSTYLKKIEYQNDILINELTIDKSNKLIELEKNISGEWFNIGLTPTDISFCKQYKCSLFFTRDNSEYKRSSTDVYDYLNLKKNKELVTKISRNCYVGQDITKEIKPEKWSVNKKGELILNDRIWKIEYLSDKVMIISTK